jgi:NADPH-dependent 2,4-dienoyl-CoA reductase/sulfur reductase-like enzyme
MELAQQAGLPVERGILVDEYLRAGPSGVYAAGDVAQIFDPVSGRSVLESLWGSARHQGAQAGWNMASPADELRPYTRPPSVNVTRLAHLTTTIIGVVNSGRDEDLVAVTRGSSEAWNYRGKGTPLEVASIALNRSDVNHLRLMIGERTILGAVVMGDQSLAAPLQRMVIAKVDISSIRERLLRPNAPVGDLIAQFWSAYAAQRS